MLMRLALLLLLFGPIVTHAQLIAAKEKGKKYGYVDFQGNYVIAPQYDQAYSFSEGYAVVVKGKHYGVINTKNEFVIKPVYKDANEIIREGKAAMYNGEKWGVIDLKTGAELVPFTYESVGTYNEGYVIVSNLDCDTKAKDETRCDFSILDDKGEVVYQSTGSDLIGLDDVVNQKVRGGTLLRQELIDTSYYHSLFDVKKLQPMLFGAAGRKVGRADNSVSEFSELKAGLIPVQISEDSVGYFGVNGLIQDAENSLSKDLRFAVRGELGYPFFNGVAVVVRNGKLSLIDDHGKTLADTPFDATLYGALPPMHFNGLIGLFKRGEGNTSLVGYIDLKGNVVIPFQFEEYHPFEYEVTAVKYKGKYGLIRKDGTWAVPARFEELNIGFCPCFR